VAMTTVRELPLPVESVESEDEQSSVNLPVRSQKTDFWWGMSQSFGPLGPDGPVGNARQVRGRCFAHTWL
jgi:hypothetical protein